MTEPDKVAAAAKKYQSGLLALGAGMIFDNPIISALGLFLLYNRAVTPDAEPMPEESDASDLAPLTDAEIGYNRAIFILGVGMVAALLLVSFSLPTAASVISTTTFFGCWLFRNAGRLEEKVDLLDAAADFKRYVEGKKLGYSIAPVAEKNERLCFRVSPLWLPRHFVVSVLPGTGKAGGQSKALEGADVAVQWFPTARAGKAFQHNGVLIANGGPALLEEAIRGALSEMLIVEDLEPSQT